MTIKNKKAFEYKIICLGCGKTFEPFLKHNFHFHHSCPFCDTSNTYEENSSCFSLEYVRCKECGGKVCVCNDGPNKWAAHCMDCDNSIGKRGYYNPCAKSKFEAISLWSKLNTG